MIQAFKLHTLFKNEKQNEKQNDNEESWLTNRNNESELQIHNVDMNRDLN